LVSGVAGDLAHASISLANMAVKAAASAGRGFDGVLVYRNQEQP
jgi:hypothetical protein